MDKAYALYLSYNRWLHEQPLDCVDHSDVADATGLDPADLDERWNDGCYPQDGEIFDPTDED